MDFKAVQIPLLSSPAYGKMRKYDEDLAKMLQDLVRNLKSMFDGGISLVDNTDSEMISLATHAVADTEFSVAHALKRTPYGYLVISRSKGGVIYDGPTSWTPSAIYLKCTTTSTLIRILIF